MAGMDWNAPLPSAGDGGKNLSSLFPDVFGAPSAPQTTTTAPKQTASKSSFMDRVEDRWRRRQGDE